MPYRLSVSRACGLVVFVVAIAWMVTHPVTTPGWPCIAVLGAGLAFA